jgi:cell division protein FtsX
MKRRHHHHRKAAPRQGMMSLEVVMSIAIMVPVAAALLFLGVKMLSALYQMIGGLVSWPFL